MERCPGRGKDESKTTSQVMPWESEDTITAITWESCQEAVTSTLLTALPEDADIGQRRRLVGVLQRAYDTLRARQGYTRALKRTKFGIKVRPVR